MPAELPPIMLRLRLRATPIGEDGADRGDAFDLGVVEIPIRIETTPKPTSLHRSFARGESPGRGGVVVNFGYGALTDPEERLREDTRAAFVEDTAKLEHLGIPSSRAPEPDHAAEARASDIRDVDRPNPSQIARQARSTRSSLRPDEIRGHR